MTNTKIIWFIEKKLEKLTAGIYAVTDSVSDQEPLKWRLRSQAVSFIFDRKNFRSLKDNNDDRSVESVFYGQILTDKLTGEIDRMIGLLELAKIGSVVSPINCSILLNEYQALKQKLSAEISSLKPALDTPLPPAMIDRPTITSDRQTSPTPTAGRPRPPISRPTLTDDPKSERKAKIRAFLADKDWVSVKDLTAHIPDCSTKTIQRELIELVDQKILQKTGQRRWSRYRLVR